MEESQSESLQTVRRIIRAAVRHLRSAEEAATGKTWDWRETRGFLHAANGQINAAVDVCDRWATDEEREEPK